MSENFLKKVNFFNGLLADADIWNTAHDYHIEKSKFHNKYLHTPGIAYIGNNDKSLMVTAAGTGTAVNVAPGYAIDGDGNTLYLPKQNQIVLDNLRIYDPQTTVYVYIKYNKRKSEEKKNWANPNEMEVAYYTEEPEVGITREKPDNDKFIELARIKLSQNPTLINEAADPKDPKPDEIDLRHRQKAGSKSIRVTVADLGEVITEDTNQEVDANDEIAIPIKLVKKEDYHQFYLASVYPKEKAHIRWYIESRGTQEGYIQYMLIIVNRSDKNVPVHYRVYRL